MLKHELRVASYELLVTNWKNHELKFKSANSNQRVTSHVQIHEFWVQIHKLRVRIHKLRVQIYELRA